MARSSAGLKDDQVVLEPEATEELIKSYCRDNGVRNLKKYIEKVITIAIILYPIDLSTI